MPQSLAETLQSIRASLAGQDRAQGESESIRLAFLFIELHERARALERARLLEGAEPEVEVAARTPGRSRAVELLRF